MNTAVGGGLGGPVDDSALPFLFEIEYVRVYQKKELENSLQYFTRGGFTAPFLRLHIKNPSGIS